MSNDLFRINIHSIIFSVDIINNKRYVLSTDENKIEFPIITLDKQTILSINSTLIKNIKNYVYVSDLELLPQLITPHSKQIPNEDSTPTINMIYGFIINYTTSINNSYWIEYNYIDSHKYSDIIIETIQKLK
jgi:hypothetical protein